MALTLVTIATAGACVPDGGAIRLASIDQIESHEIVAGEEFKIFGDGFIPGSVEIVLDGQWLAAGKKPWREQMQFHGNAVTEREISTVLPVETFRKVGVPHALFEGRIRARFAASEKVRAHWIEAVRSRMTLDVLSSEPDGGRDTSLLEKQSRRFLARMGVEGRSDPEGGFAVVKIREAGPAGAAGLRAGDLILVSRGLRVYSELDLLPPASEARTSWVVMRSSGAAESRSSLEKLTVDIPRDAAAAGPDPVWIAAGAAAIALVAMQGEILGLLLMPLVWLGRKVASLVARLRRKEREVLSIEDGPAGWQEPASRWMQNILSTPFVIVIASACVAILHTHSGSIHVAAVYVALVALAWATGIQSTRGAARPGATVKRLVACLAAPAPVALILLWRGLFVSSMSLEAAAEGQAMEPWTWHGLVDPFAAMMLLAALHTALLPERRDISLLRHLAHQAYSVVACTVIVYVMMGGSEISIPAADPGATRTTGIELGFLIAKVMALYLVLHARSRERALGDVADPVVLAGLVMLLVGALVGSVTAGPLLGSWVPQLPQITACVFGALMLIHATAAGRTSGTCSVRVQPW